MADNKENLAAADETTITTSPDNVSLEEQMEALKRARLDAVKRLKETTSKLNKLVVSHTRLQQAKQETDEELTEAKDDIVQSQKLIEELKRARDEAVLQRQETGEALHKLRSDNETLRVGQRTLGGQLKELNAMPTKFSDLEAQRDVAEKELQEAIEKHQMERDAHRREMEKLEAEKAAAERELNKKHLLDRDAHNREMEEQRSELEKELREARATQQNLQDDVDRLERANDSKDRRIAETQKNLAAMQESQKADRLSDLETKNSTLNNKLSELEGQRQKERKKAQDEIRALKKERAGLLDEVAQSRKLERRDDSKLEEALGKIGKLEAKLGVTRQMKISEMEGGSPPKTENDILFEELAKSQTENARVQSELQELLTGDFSELKGLHSSMQGGLKGANDELEAGIAVARHLQERLDESDAFNQALQEENQAMEKVLEAVQDKLKATNAECKNAKDEIEQLSQMSLATGKERDKLQNQIDRLLDELKRSKKKISLLKETLKSERVDSGESRGLFNDDVDISVDSQVSSEGRTKELETELMQARNRIEALERQLSELGRKSSEDVLALSSERGDKVSSLERKLKENAKALDVQVASRKAEELADRHERTIKQLEADLAEAVRENDYLEKKKGEAERRYADESKKLRSEQSSLSRIKGELKDAQESNEKSEALIGSLRRRLSGLEDELSISREEKSKAIRRCAEQESSSLDQLRAARSERDILQVRLAEVASELEVLRTRSTAKEASLMQQLSDLQAAAGETDQQVRGTIGALRTDLASSEKAKEDAERRNDALRRELEEARLSSRRSEELSQQRGLQVGDISRLGLELGSVKNENALLKERISNLERLRDDYNRLKEAERSAAMASREESSRLSRQVDKSNLELSDLKNRFDKKVAELERLQDDHRDLKKSNQSIARASRDAAVALSKQLDERNTEIEGLKSKLRETNRGHLVDKEELRKIDRENESNKASIREKCKELDGAIAEKNRLHAEGERKSREINEMRVARDSLQDSLKSAEALAERLRHQRKTENQANNESIQRLTKDLILAEKEARLFGQQLDEAKSKLKEAAKERRNQNAVYVKEADGLRSRISHLEAVCNGSRQAFSEAISIKDTLGAQLKAKGEDLAAVSAALASHEKHASSKERQGQIAFQRLAEKAENKAEKLEQKLSSVTKERNKFEQELSSLLAERNGLDKELRHVQDELGEALAHLSSLQLSFDEAESTLIYLIQSLAEILRDTPDEGHVGGKGTGEEANPGVDSLIHKLRAVVGGAIQGREDAAQVGKDLESQLEDLKATNERLTNEMNEKEQLLTELRKTHNEEKGALMAELIELESSVEQVSSENKNLVEHLRLRLEGADGEIDRLESGVQLSSSERDALCAAREKLANSLSEATTALVHLEAEKAVLKDSANKEKATLVAENESLKKSLDEAVVARDRLKVELDQTNDASLLVKESSAGAKRARVLEHTLGEKERKLVEASDRLRELEAQKDVLRNDAMKLKRFLEEALTEAKLLLYMLREAKFGRSSDRNGAPLGGGAEAAALGDVLTRLEDLVGSISDGFDGLDNAAQKSQNDSRTSWSSVGQEGRPNPTSEKRRKTSPTSSMADLGLELTEDDNNPIESSAPNKPLRSTEVPLRNPLQKWNPVTSGKHWEEGETPQRGNTGSRPPSRSPNAVHAAERTKSGCAHDRNPQQEYVRQRLAQSAAAGGTSDKSNAREIPFRSSHLRLPPPMSFPPATSRQPQRQPRHYGSDPEVFDPEVFNSPYLRTRPQRTPHLQLAPANDRPGPLDPYTFDDYGYHY